MLRVRGGALLPSLSLRAQSMRAGARFVSSSRRACRAQPAAAGPSWSAALPSAPSAPSTLSALSPLDGRYGGGAAMGALRACFSEAAVMRARVRVEAEWLRALAAAPGVPEVAALPADADAALERIVAGFSLADAERVKAIEAKTNHDVGAARRARARAAGAELRRAPASSHAPVRRRRSRPSSTG